MNNSDGYWWIPEEAPSPEQETNGYQRIKRLEREVIQLRREQGRMLDTVEQLTATLERLTTILVQDQA